MSWSLDSLIESLHFPVDVNDIHSGLNKTRVQRVVRPKTTEEVSTILQKATMEGASISVAGGRHSMGGQAFLTNGLLLDMRSMNDLLSLGDVNRSAGCIAAKIGAGCLWPDLQKKLRKAQDPDDTYFSFRQKQTGGDRLSLGGSLSSNIHTRGLRMKPMVDDIESMTVVTPSGEVKHVSRQENADLFRLIIGGYGLFGVVTEVNLRLKRRHRVRRRVSVITTEGLIDAFNEKIAQGFEFGDFQFAIDDKSDDYLHKGVFSCYEPLDVDVQIGPRREESPNQLEVPRAAWHHLVYLAHTDKSKAFELYADFYKRSDGQIYWSDSHQMTPYLDNYHRKLDRKTKARCPGSEMITELYVPRKDLESFLDLCRTELKQANANIIYGTIRLVEADDETFLAWATQPWACTIFNLHVDHDPQGIERAKSQFRLLIDIAQKFGGTFYLTYHRWATKQQIEKSYPQMPDFLAKKLEYDPQEILSSDWYRHLKSLFA